MKVDQTVEYVLKFLTTSWGRVPLLGLPLYIWSETAVPLCSPLPAGVQSMTPVGSGTHTLRHLEAGHGVLYIHSSNLTAPWHSWWAEGQSLPLIQVPSISWHRHRDLKILGGLLSPMVWSDRPLEKADAWFAFPRLQLRSRCWSIIGRGMLGGGALKASGSAARHLFLH